MSNTIDIRQLYSPVQPTVRQAGDIVVYREFLPDSRLQPYIYCYWQLKTREALAEQINHLVVADGCMDIYFDLNNPQENYVMGFCNQYTEFLLDNTFHYIGIRFLPTMFPQLFNIHAKELSNRYEHLTMVLPHLSGFISSRFNETQSEEQIRSLLDNYFLEHIARTSFDNDNRLYGAIEIILKNSGVINMEKDLDTGISPRQLRRLFEFYIGDTQKTFCKVVRFQHLLRTDPSIQRLRKEKLFFDAGYYDQAHFIKEFRNFYGLTPGRAFDK